MPAPTAAVIVIGDEILSGKFADENAVYLVGELRRLGVRLRRIEVIPDDVAEIGAAVAAAAARFDHVFTSGGVGPTHDDLTMAGVAAAFGVDVVRHPELERLLREFYGARLEERNLRMADVPRGATLLAADHPHWPVTAFRNVVILPGIPAIFRRKFDAIRHRFQGAPLTTRRVYCLGEEGELAAHLDAVVAEYPMVAVGSYPRLEAADHRVLVTLEGEDADAVHAAAAALARRLPPALLVRVE